MIFEAVLVYLEYCWEGDRET